MPVSKFWPRIDSWVVIAQSQHYDVIKWSDYQREKSVSISKHDVCGNNYDPKTPYIVYLKYIFLYQAKTAECGKFSTMLYWKHGCNFFFLVD